MHRTIPVSLLIFSFMFLLVNVSRAQDSAADIEPNNSWEQAVLINGWVIEGRVGESGDLHDWYRLGTQVGKNPEFSLVYDSDSYDIDIRVYSDTEMVGSVASRESPDSGTFEISGTCFIDVIGYESAGDYTIIINGGGDGTGAGETFDPACSGPDESEPNDDRFFADEITTMTIRGTACDGDEDWFLLSGQEGVTPKLTLEYNHSECDIDLIVYSDTTIANTLSETTSPDTGEFTIPGQCYLKVFAYDGSGDYTIRIETVESGIQGLYDSIPWQQDTSSNDSEAKALTLKSPDFTQPDTILGVSGHQVEGTDSWFKIEAGSVRDGNYILTLDYNMTECDLDLEYYRNNTVNESITGASSPDSKIIYITGESFIRLFSYWGSGDFHLTLRPQAASAGGRTLPTPCQGPDEVEPNDDPRAADLIDGYEIRGYACAGEEDWFMLDGQEGSGPWFELTYDPPCDIDLEVFDGNDKSVGTLSATGSPDMGQFKVEGRCYLKVWAHDGEGEYRIVITPSDAPEEPSSRGV